MTKNTTSPERSRAFSVVSTFLTREMIADFIEEHPEMTAVGIVHDRDAAQVHGHLFFYAGEARPTVETVKKMFAVSVVVLPFLGDADVKFQTGKFQMARCYRYCLHGAEHQGVKAQYTREELICSPNFDWESALSDLEAYEAHKRKVPPLFQRLQQAVLFEGMTAREVAEKHVDLYAKQRKLWHDLESQAAEWNREDLRKLAAEREAAESAKRAIESERKAAEREVTKLERAIAAAEAADIQQVEFALEAAETAFCSEDPTTYPVAWSEKIEALTEAGKAAAAVRAKEEAKAFARDVYVAIGRELNWTTRASTWESQIKAAMKEASAFYEYVSRLDDPSDDDVASKVPALISEAMWDPEDVADLDANPFTSPEATLVFVTDGFAVGKLSPSDDIGVHAAAVESVDDTRGYINGLANELSVFEHHVISDADESLIPKAAEKRIEMLIYGLEPPAPKALLTKAQKKKLMDLVHQSGLL